MTVDLYAASQAIGRPAHAWLVIGPRGAGKAAWARARAAELLQTPEDRLAAPDAAHPDFRLVAPPAEGKDIGVDEARALSSFLRLTATGPWKAAVIADADQMNRNAANALLKLLEEPPPRTTLFLTASAPGRLPITIRSRCRRMVISGADARDAAAALRQTHGDAAGDDIDRALTLAGGDLALADSILDLGLFDLAEAMAALARSRSKEAGVLALADRIAPSGETGRRALIGAIDVLVRRVALDATATRRRRWVERRDAAVDILEAQRYAHLDARRSTIDAASAFLGL